MSERRPVIGISAALENARHGAWEEPSALLPMNYVKAVQRAGGMALIIPQDPALIDDPDEVLNRIDGLMLIGGGDIDPATYGSAPHAETAGVVPERDALEIALANGAIEHDLPLLGICRGMQILNIARGGTLIQHLPEVVGHGDHRRHAGTFEGNDHEVLLDPGSLAAKAAGEQCTNIKSHHHQAIDQLGHGLVISGRSTLDQLPEAIEGPASTYVLGVQWHPEADEDSRVIASLVSSSRATASARVA